MRTLDEISKDLAKALSAQLNHRYTNVGGVFGDDLAKITARSMELDRAVYQLQEERNKWVEVA
jgi:hypothetical protein